MKRIKIKELKRLLNIKKQIKRNYKERKDTTITKINLNNIAKITRKGLMRRERS